MKLKQKETKRRRIYVAPEIVEEEVFERRALAACGKTNPTQTLCKGAGLASS